MGRWHVLLIVVGIASLIAIGMTSESPSKSYESPCVMSWDENDGDSTFCILTPEAAAREKKYGGSFEPAGSSN